MVEHSEKSLEVFEPCRSQMKEEDEGPDEVECLGNPYERYRSGLGV